MSTAVAKVTKDTIAKKLGGHNNMPPNWETITESEYLWRFTTGPAARVMAYKQVQLPSVGYGEDVADSANYDRNIFCSVYLWVNPDWSGYGFITHYNGKATRTEIDAYAPQYFKFAVCSHAYITQISRMCYWQGKCNKCGYVKSVDSSD